MNDQLYIIEGPVSASAIHPLLYNLALSVCVRGSLAVFGSGNPGFALFVSIQIVICAGIVSFCCMWLRYREAPVLLLVLVVAYFGLVPIVSNYAVNAWKDTLFGFLMLLWVPLAWEACFSPTRFWGNKKSYALIAVLLALISLTRNNGILIAIAATALLLVASRRHVDMRRAASALAVAVGVCMVVSFLPSLHGVHHLFRESLNVPLQQLSSVQVAGNERLDGESRDFLDDILPSENARDSYMPVDADGIKYKGWFDPENDLDNKKMEFIRAYFDAGIKYPDSFTRAFLSQTYGNWSLIAFDAEQSYELSLSGNLLTSETILSMESLGLHNESLYPENVNAWFCTTYPKFLVFLGPGACFAVVLLLGFALTIRSGSAKALLVVLPLTLLWCTLMLATPISLALRYVFPMVCALPVLVATLAIQHAD